MVAHTSMLNLVGVVLILLALALAPLIVVAKAKAKAKGKGEDKQALCSLSLIALDAAGVLLPGCRRGEATTCESQRADVYKGLSLASKCKVAVMPAMKSALGSEGPAPLSSTAHVFYVSVNGSDSNIGTDRASAFLNLERALQAVASKPRADSKVLIVLPGKHRLKSSVKLGAEHSNVVIVGESPVDRPQFTTLIPLPRATNPCNSLDKNLVRCQIHPDIASKLGTLSALFVNGVAMIRARTPNIPDALGQAYDRRKAKKWGTTKPAPLVAGIHMKIIPSDDPNVVYHQISPSYNRFTLGYVNPTDRTVDPPVSYFYHPSHIAQGKCPYTLPASATWKAKVLVKKWSNPSIAIFHALHWYGWGQWSFWVKSQQPNKITLGKGGWQETRGDCRKGGGMWWAENARELLDAKNEYFLSLATNELFYFPSSSALNPVLDANVEIELTLPLHNLVEVKGESSTDVVNGVTFRNIEFFGAYTTTMERFEAPSGGDWTIHRSGAVLAENVTNLVVEDCSFKWCGGNALTVSKMATNVTIERNEFFALGASAIIVAGDPGFFTPDPWVIKNYPSNVKIIGNVASYIGLHVKQVSAAFFTLSRSVTIEGNVFYMGPRAGITMNDQYGSPHLIRSNVVFEMVRGTSDHGPFILWNRQQFADPIPKDFDVIEENLFFGTPGLGPDGGGKGVNVDDGAHKVISRNNVIAVGFQKIKGSFVHAYGNVIVYPVMASCVYFSTMIRIPANLRFTNNTCVGYYPPYAYGLGKNDLRGYCDTHSNFFAANNTFYWNGKNDRLEQCAGSWQKWTRQSNQDQGTLYVRSKNLPSTAVVTAWMLRALPWVPQ